MAGYVVDLELEERYILLFVHRWLVIRCSGCIDSDSDVLKNKNKIKLIDASVAYESFTLVSASRYAEELSYLP